MARRQASKKVPENGGISTRAFVAVIAAGLVLSIASVLFGRADAGVINVAEVVSQSNAAAAESEGSDSRAANKPVVNARPDRPNGGLVGTGNKPDPDARPNPPAGGEPEVEGTSTSTNATSAEEIEAAESTEDSIESSEENTEIPEGA